jgi:hypothetical protein
VDGEEIRVGDRRALRAALARSRGEARSARGHARPAQARAELRL